MSFIQLYHYLKKKKYLKKSYYVDGLLEEQSVYNQQVIIVNTIINQYQQLVQVVMEIIYIQKMNKVQSLLEKLFLLIILFNIIKFYNQYVIYCKQLSIKCSTKQQVIDHSKIKHNVMKMQQNDYNYFYHVFKKALFNSGRYPSDLELLDLLKDVFKQSNYIDVAWALQKFDITHQVNKIKGPVLLYHGLLDKICPISDAYTNIHFIGKNKCTLVVHQDVSHMPPLEVPEDLAVHVINYLYSLK